MKILPQQNLIVISLEQIDGAWPNRGGDRIFPSVTDAALARFAR
jgi:hypothetical protein